MYKSILAISEGGPEAAISFRLAAGIAAIFEATGDAVHFSETHPGDGDIAAQAMPFLKRLTDDRLKARGILPSHHRENWRVTLKPHWRQLHFEEATG